MQTGYGISVGEPLEKAMKRLPRHDEEAIARKFDQWSRQPFSEYLAHLMSKAPEGDDLEAWARRSPDRWGQLVAIFAKLAGFTEKSETFNYNLNVNAVAALPDSALKDQVQRLAGMMALGQQASEINTIKDITPDAEVVSEDPPGSP